MKLAKQFLMIAAIVAITLTYGCKKETPDNNESQPTISVTYSLLNGAWELVAWDGAPLAEGTYLYVEFDRTEHRFKMWDNIGSMYPRSTTGIFNIEKDDYERYILSGYYDHGVGYWNQSYEVVAYSNDEMVWRSMTTGEQTEYRRIDAIPEL